MTVIPPCKFAIGDLVAINSLGEARLKSLNLNRNLRYKVAKVEWQPAYSKERGYIVHVEKFGGRVDAFWEAFLTLDQIAPMDATEYEDILSAQEVYESLNHD